MPVEHHQTYLGREDIPAATAVAILVAAAITTDTITTITAAATIKALRSRSM